MAPRPELTKIVRNQSARQPGNWPPKLIVLHSTESANVKGLTDLQSLASWFDNPAAQASAHVANDAEGNDARFVMDERKAWSCAAYNSPSLNIEQVGRAAQLVWPEEQLKNTAQWIAYWSLKYKIPIQHGAVLNGRVTKPGIVMHSELGSIGGNHHDPGPSYPLMKVLKMASAYALGATPSQARAKQLALARSKLRSVLNARAKLRQQRLEIARQYDQSEKDMTILKAQIVALKQKVGMA